MFDNIAQIQRRYQLFPQVDVVAVNGIVVEASGLSEQSLQAFGAIYARQYGMVKDSIKQTDAFDLLRMGTFRSSPTFNVQSDAIVWLNDLEQDEQYTNHPKTLRSILRHSNTGFFELSRNLVTTVIFIDPSNEKSPEILTQLTKGWMKRDAPIRFGLVLSNGQENDSNAVLIRSFYGILNEHGAESALQFLSSV